MADFCDTCKHWTLRDSTSERPAADHHPLCPRAMPGGVTRQPSHGESSDMEQLGRAQRRAFIEDAVRLRSLRPQVRAFAEAMEAQLRANDHKGGWQECSLAYLYGRVAEELEELSAETDRAERDTAAVRREAADVAAFVMMIADVCGALTEPRNG